MRRLNRTICWCFIALPMTLCAPAYGQGNIDWEEWWLNQQPDTNSHHMLGWMAGQRQYTGLAYDKWRDLLYVVNTALVTVGSRTVAVPKIRILDPYTGIPVASIGRIAAGVPGETAGLGGQLPVPLDTMVASPAGWPDSSYGGHGQGQFSLFKIDLDDEGRIYACNLVVPVWGMCHPGPPPNCDSAYLRQGPFRVYRWDTPSSTPRLIYATCDSAHTQIGSIASSEMPGSRWGDAFDVVGKRDTVFQPPSPQPIVHDSTRIYVSGAGNSEIAVLLPDSRASRPLDTFGRPLEFRLGARLISNIPDVAGGGIAATGRSSTAGIWMDGPTDSVRHFPGAQGSGPLPHKITMSGLHSLSTDPITGTGASAAIAYLTTPYYHPNQWLICADGRPTDPSNPAAPNYNTRARVMNISVRSREFREPYFGDTPYLGNKALARIGGNSWISDVDHYLEVYSDSGKILYLYLFILMSDNGIAAWRTRFPFPVGPPVEFSAFNAALVKDHVLLNWTVESETNNYGFHVERSFDASTAWEDIGFVQGRGSSRLPRDYTYFDPLTRRHRECRTAHYRLRQQDFDGAAEYSPVVDIIMDPGNGGFETLSNHPNPFNSITRILYTMGAPGRAILKVCNPLGAEIATLVDTDVEAGSHSATFDARGLPPGVYYCRLYLDGRAAARPIILSR